MVAIPAHNEAGYIENCLAALAVQRDEAGAPIPSGQFEILIFANDCTDGTTEIAKAFARRVPHPVSVLEENLPDGQTNAGWARKRAMDLAAIRLAKQAGTPGIILTTDADSTVSTTWFSATLRELDRGVDCVAGYIDANPLEMLALGPAFLSRGRLEDAYLRLVAEIYALCDPRLHDLWPNHRVSSGASLAVTLPAYASIGGLPPRALGEDIALTVALDRAGFKVRHSMDVCVSTSCRFDGRAQGGAADTMRHRHQVPDAPCDDEFEPALQLVHRAIYKGVLRTLWSGKFPRILPAELALTAEIAHGLTDPGIAFEDAWQTICLESPVLKRSRLLRPSDLPREIAMAEGIVRTLRAKQKKIARDDTRHLGESLEAAFAS